MNASSVNQKMSAVIRLSLYGRAAITEEVQRRIVCTALGSFKKRQGRQTACPTFVLF
jgi:hypothetical protein